MKSKTLNVSIACDAEKVYTFVSNPENLPKWAKTFVKSIKQSGQAWEIDTAEGSMKIRFAPKNDFGIVDHFINPAPGIEIYVPMRVVPNGEDSEVIFTLFQGPGMSDEQFSRDQKMVAQDLNTLKTLLE